MSLADVENRHEFLFEDFELSELIEPLLDSSLIGSLELHTFLHELMDFFVEKSNLNHITTPCIVFFRAAWTDQDILFLETLLTRAYLVSLKIMFRAEFWT